ncbi:rhodanese-related sulfurtransferase [Blastococcus sp. Marseille-P5729]|uniref:oxygen-dependent tRNA uridine(34) hydroxylase TrhO n=1 Tax=Blastococcus sp. Marseille-P5729 TaxID=2086582 RepID=UPI0018FE59A8|nr:rhodanese-related sulfurtransferase [Blastococcus sp. Marseille-P5729]
MQPSRTSDGRVVMPKIVLFYLFTPLADPESIRLWQRELCERYDLTGRILISKDGINGTVGGAMADVKRYVRRTKEYAAFKQIDFKWSDGTGEDFPRLSVRVRDEIVTFGVPDEVKVDKDGVIGGGTHLSPEQVHELVADRGDDVVFFDGRNAIEASVGRFRGAVVPDVTTTRDFIRELDSGKYDDLKQRPVISYCTGGIRCEVLSVLMKNRGFEEVYQIDGGIVRYAEEYGDDGLWDGSLFVFDKRMTVDYSDHTKVIGECAVCGAATKEFLDCARDDCKALEVVCGTCQERSSYCTAHR